MEKESILSSIFIFIISAIMIYISVVYLGQNNLMVGITGLFMLIAILNKDFSKTPIRATFKISFLTAFIGIVPYIVNLNIYIGFFINFIAIFIMIYLVVYTLNKTMFFPFLFGYTLFLTTNVTGRNLNIRIISLIVLGIIAVLFQIIFIRFVRKKEMENENFIDIIDSLIVNIEKCSVGEIDHDSFDDFRTFTTKWSRDILEKRNNSFYLKEDENIELNLIASLESMAHTAKKMAKKVSDGEIKYTTLLLDINKLLLSLKGFINKEHEIEVLNVELDRLNVKYCEDSTIIEVYEVLESLRVIDSLTDHLVELESARFKHHKMITISEFKKECKTTVKLLIKDFNKDSVRFIFAFRTALIVSLAYFAIRYFNVPIGKWMIFTITSVSQPYNNTVKNRAKGRMLGTLVGVIIYLPLSLLFTGFYPRIVITGIAVFLMLLFKKYAYSTAMLTVLFLGVVTIHDKYIFAYADDRIIFIALGIIAVLIGNKIIFPYSLEKETKILIRKYYDSCTDILDSTMKIYSKKGIREEIRKLILISKGFENKIVINNTALDSDMLRKFRNEQRMFLSRIHNMLNRVEFSDKSLMGNGSLRMEKIEHMREKMKDIPIDEIDILDKIFRDTSKNITKMSEMLMYLDAYEMIKSHKSSKKIMRALTVKI